MLSTRFSAADSMAADATSSAASSCVGRLTRSRPTSIRADPRSPARSAVSTPCVASSSRRSANAGFRASASSTTPIQLNLPATLASARAPAQALPTTSVTAAAPSAMLRPGARRSAQPSARPIQATGCQRAAGSPSDEIERDRQEEDRWPPEPHRRGIPSRTARRAARARHHPATVSGAEVRHPRAAAGPCDHHRVGHRAGRLHALGREDAGLHERPDLRLGRRDDAVHRRAALEPGVEHGDQVDRRRLPDDRRGDARRRRPAQPDRRDRPDTNAVGVLPRDGRALGPGRGHEPDEGTRDAEAPRERAQVRGGIVGLVVPRDVHVHHVLRGVEIAANHGRREDRERRAAAQPHRRRADVDLDALDHGVRLRLRDNLGHARSELPGMSGRRSLTPRLSRRWRGCRRPPSVPRAGKPATSA